MRNDTNSRTRPFSAPNLNTRGIDILPKIREITHTASITQCLSNSTYRFLHRRIILCCLLVRHTDILQHLRIDLQRCCQLTHRLLLGQHDFHHLQTSQNTITGTGVLAENDMTTLLTTNAAAVLCHILVDILITNGGLGITDALLIKCLVQTKVGHDGGNNSVGQQLAALLHVAAIDVQNMIASNDIALLVHTQTAVSVSIVCKAHVQTFLHDELLQALDVRRAGIVVDVQAIRLVVDYIGICAQCVKDRLCNIPRATVSAVQTNLDTLERIDAQRDQVAHIAVATCHIVHSAANMLTMRKGQFRPVFVEYMELAVNVVLHEQQSLFRHLFTVAVDQLDAQKVKISNLQQMARTVAYVQEHGYDSRENLSETADAIYTKMAKARGDAKLTESKLRKTNEQIHYLGQYLSTKSIYGEFLKAPNKKIFRQAHSDELAQYEEALQILKQYSPDGKFPTMKDLRAEKAQLTIQKDAQYDTYRYFKDYHKELQTVCANVDSILGAEQELQQHEQQHTRKNETPL